MQQSVSIGLAKVSGCNDLHRSGICAGSRPKDADRTYLRPSSCDQVWDLAKRYRNTKGYFFRQYFDREEKKLVSKMEHILVWERLYKKEVPHNCCIHHRDLDPTNNNAENLLCLPVFLHLELHARLRNAKKVMTDLEFQVKRQYITVEYEIRGTDLMELWRVIDMYLE
ncbi:HNH endonuclease [Geomonas ferrireducens]|uniref:HNH endonuclease n=1 Tax=Geomonas ferrireducens TaxID=2570227 RepID=UPI0010A8167E|nr:HNH endonuclease [Geomonas ferrireducens]